MSGKARETARKATRGTLAKDKVKDKGFDKGKGKGIGKGLRSLNSTSEGPYATINEEDVDWGYGSPWGSEAQGEWACSSMTVGSDMNAPWNVGAAGPDPSWTQEQEGSAWNGFYSVVSRRAKNRTAKPTMRSMTSNVLDAPPGLSSLSARPREQEGHEVKVKNSFK